MRTPVKSLLLAAVLAGCAPGTRKTPLLVYSPHGKDMLSAFEAAYEQVHPDVDVQWLDMGSQDAYERIKVERNNPQADIWWGGPMTMFERAEAESLLAPYKPSWSSVVPDDARSPHDGWYGTFYTPEVIMYNNQMLSDQTAPSDWDALLDPQWRGKIILRSPPASGTMRVIFCAIVQREIRRTGNPDAGYAWLHRLDANTKTYVADPTQLYLRIARGEAPVSLWDMPDVELQIHKTHDPFGYHMPSSGTPVLVEGIAVVRGAPHPHVAASFYEFVTSRQSILRQAREFFRVPVRTDIPADSLPAWINTHPWKPMTIDWRDLAAHEEQWMQYWDEHIKGEGARSASTP
jgi:iron(III) transport system substrate-binding protein